MLLFGGWVLRHNSKTDKAYHAAIIVNIENEFERLFTLARIANFTAQEMEDYMHTFKQCDYYNVIRTAEEEARERGHAIGLAEGKAEGRVEGERNMALNIAKRLLASGMPIEEVTKMTGLNTMDIAD